MELVKVPPEPITAGQAYQFNRLYWSLYWSGHAETARALVGVMRGAGIDASGRIIDPDERSCPACRTTLGGRIDDQGICNACGWRAE